MSQFLISVVAFIITIGLLVTVHEFGHFWVARRFGIKVLRFSIGFGWPLYRWYDKLGTEYVLSAIPLGGYVALFGERGQIIPATEQSMAFSHRSVWIRMCVLAAGPLFNLAFAVVAYWAMFLMGVIVFAPILGNVPTDSVASLAGLQKGQEIIAVEGKRTPTWEAVSGQLLSHLGEDKTITLTVKGPEPKAKEIQKTLDLAHWSDTGSDSNWLDSLGLFQMDPVPAVIAKTLPDLPAAQAGLQANDKILSVDAQPIHSRSDFIQAIQGKPNQWITLQIDRQDKTLKITLKPMSKQSESGKEIGFIGAEFPSLDDTPKELVHRQHFGVVESLIKGFHRMVEYSFLTLDVLRKMILGEVSFRYINGPIMIAKYAGQTAGFGLKHFLDFLGMLSVSLGVINLLPIPILDGGHMLYCVYELLTGRRVSETVQNVGMWIGATLLMGFMTLAFYNDLSSIFR